MVQHARKKAKTVSPTEQLRLAEQTIAIMMRDDADFDHACEMASQVPPLQAALRNDFKNGHTVLPSVRMYANRKYYQVHAETRLW